MVTTSAHASPGEGTPEHTTPADAAAETRTGFFSIAQVGDLFGIDPRALAFLRVGIAFQILRDLAERAPYLADHYSDWGLLPRSVLLETYGNESYLCLHLISGNTYLMGGLFVINAILAVALLVGFRTRLMAILCYVFLLSLEARNPLITNGGDVLFRMVLFWALFMPMGARWSIDAALARKDDEPVLRKPYLSGATFALIAQLCLMYWFGAALKLHPVWYEGRAVWYALNVDMFATPFGVWLRQFTAILPVMTWMTLAGEILGPLFALLGFKWLRVLAILGLMTMHICFSMCLDIGLFTLVAIIAWGAFLPACFWNAWARWLYAPARAADLRLLVATGDRLAHARLRIVREFLLTPETPISELTMPEGMSWGVVDHAGRVRTGWRATRLVIETSPWTRWLRPLLRWNIGNALGAATYAITREGPGRVMRSITLLRPKSLPVSSGFGGSVIALALLAYVVMWNFRGLPDDLKSKLSWKWEMPQSWNVLTKVIRLDQRWSMFAPIPMTGDGWYVMPAKLVDGRRIDLLTGKPVTWEKPALVSAQYIDQRWRKWMENMTWAPSANLLGYGRYLARSWNARQDELSPAPAATAPATNPAEPGNHVSTFHIVYVREETTERGILPPRKVIMWRHNALGDKIPSDDGALD